jgi:hypothetical protein
VFVVIQWLAQEDHIALTFKLLDNARHHFDGKAVAEIAQDQADQIRGIGAQVRGCNIVHISQLIDSRLHSFDGGVGDFPFWRSTRETVETETPASLATSMMLTFFNRAP